MDKESVKDVIYLSSNIKFLRLSRKLNQMQLGKAFGYSATTISNWEQGFRIPESLDLYRLSTYFNIDVDSLMKTDLTNTKKEDATYTIHEIKSFIKRLPDSEINQQGKQSLISMIEALQQTNKKD